MDHLTEIESDMSVFHRVGDIYVMRSTVFFRRVSCLGAYDGAVFAQLSRQRREAQQPATPEIVPQADDEEALWARHRTQQYSQFLKPGELPRHVSAGEGLALASRVASGVR